MPGVYLAAILLSATGIGILDARFRLALWRDAIATLAAVAVGVVFFLSWDAVGIVTGVFIKGESPLFIGLDLAPHLPLEELFFLAFLSYLSLVVWSAAMRWLERPKASISGEEQGAGAEQ
ncbi:lycopene cyclase domain-containing protein [Microbacterium sp. NPDC076911]|uniref:lycopene cyclase domain-containing protein n=1 Tax=Microbacterium sp. NPDC076911 TaxID=3154958 RepID=UPI0034430189